MDIEEFRQIDARFRQEKPAIFRLAHPDRSATASEIEEVERLVGAELPGSLKAFLIEFGGGEFALEVIYSATPESDYYLPTRAENAHRVIPICYIPISDDGAGGYYVLEVKNGIASDKVYYFDTDAGDIQPTEYGDLLAFIAHYAYEPA